jgi:hypothetical protein
MRRETALSSMFGGLENIAIGNSVCNAATLT